MAKARISLSLKDFGLDNRGRKRRMKRIALTVLAEWKAMASERLNKTARVYSRALTILTVTETRAVVALPGPGVDSKVAQLARIVEFGMGAGGIGTEGKYDVRKFLLTSGTRRLRFGKSGPYVNVPFNFQKQEVMAMLTKDAGKAAMGLGGVSDATGLAGADRFAQGRIAKIKARHVTDPLDSMVRLISTYSRRKDGRAIQQTAQFRTWRRASWGGNPWWTRVKGRRIAKDVAKKVPMLVREAL